MPQISTWKQHYCQPYWFFFLFKHFYFITSLPCELILQIIWKVNAPLQRVTNRGMMVHQARLERLYCILNLIAHRNQLHSGELCSPGNSLLQYKAYFTGLKYVFIQVAVCNVHSGLLAVGHSQLTSYNHLHLSSRRHELYKSFSCNMLIQTSAALPACT